MMKIIPTILAIIFTVNTALAQKYTDTYINDANIIAIEWLNNINTGKYTKAYSLLSKEVKEIASSETWIGFINELMLEFGQFKSRRVIEKYFKSEVEGIEDGFYVFIKFEVKYSNTKNHIENLLIKQNDKLKWEILDYSYMFEDDKYAE